MTRPSRLEPLLSIVLPTRNRRRLLSRAVASALAQDFEDFELLVVNDASTDDTERWLESVEDPRLVAIHRSEPGGPAGARNEGLRRARGEYVVFLDDDDELLHGMLEEVRRTFEHTAPEAAFLWCGVETVRDEAGSSKLVKRLVWPAPATVHRYPESLLHLSAGTGFGLAVRRATVREVGPFDEDLRAAVDFDWLLRLGSSHPYTVVPKVLVRVHLHPGSQVTDPSPAKAGSFERVLEKHREFLHRHPQVERSLRHKTAALRYGLGHRRAGRAHALRMVRLEPLRLRSWRSLLLFELFRTEALGLRRLLSGRSTPSPPRTPPLAEKTER